MRYFVSAGEPSGDLHAANLIREIQSRDSAAEFFGLGGPKMQSVGCELLYPLADNPIIGISAAICAVPKLLRLLDQVRAEWRWRRPDVVVTVDYPGFHWHLAKAAKRMNIRTAYYVPPQIWSWGAWRVAKVRRFYDAVLCSLPFEPAWYHQRNVPNARFVGHPFFDDLANRTTDSSICKSLKASAPIRIALLPGSRSFEVRNNTPTLLDAAESISSRFPQARFLVAAFRPEHAVHLAVQAARRKAPIEILCGRTPEILAVADAAVAVSGSVSLELLYHRVPTVVVYRIGWLLQRVLRPLLLRSKYITLVNLMADREIFPEFFGDRDFGQEAGQVVGDWLSSPGKMATMRAELGVLCDQFAKTGAARLAADSLLEMLGSPAPASSFARRAA